MRLNEGPVPGHPAASNVVTLDRARLPSLAAATARLHRLAVDERLRALLGHTLGVAGWSVGTRNLIAPEQAVLVQLRWGMESASVGIDIAQHPVLASLVASSGPDNETLRNAVGAILLDPLLQAFGKLGMEGIEIVSFARAMQEAAPPTAQCCAVAFRFGGQRIDATINHIDAGWLEALEALVARQTTPFATRVSEITVSGRLQIG
jgi:type III secretion protein Q